MVREVKLLDAFEAILTEAGDKLVVVDFTASWCEPCINISPFFAEMAEKPENKDVVFLKVDVDDASDIASEYDIDSMPTFVFFKSGEELHRFCGADQEMLEAEVAARRPKNVTV